MSKNTTQIKAAVVREKGGPFRVEILTLEAPRRDEVLVKVVATGLCHTDMVARDKAYPLPVRETDEVLQPRSNQSSCRKTVQKGAQSNPSFAYHRRERGRKLHVTAHKPRILPRSERAIWLLGEALGAFSIAPDLRHT